MIASNLAGVTRRLAAIVIADVVGYTRLMERDDTGTFARLRTIRDEVVDPAIVSHGGRIVKTAGDGLMAEFPSALAALRASVQIQREMAARNAGVPPADRIDYRIGVNLGDVMADTDDIAGDGVNVASRLESLAEPGGICVSSAVREQVHGQLDVAFADIGEQAVKNIERPIRVHRVVMQSSGAGALSWRPSRRAIRRGLYAAATVVAVLVGVVLVRYGPETALSTTSGPKLAPSSLAIARFMTSSGDDESERYAVALRQQIIAGIGSFERRVTVRLGEGADIAPGDAVQFGRRAGARYTLTGDVRRAAGGHLANFSMIDSSSSAQVWASSPLLPDQDETDRSVIALRRLVLAITSAVRDAEIRRVVALPLDQLDATELAIRAQDAMATINLENVRTAEGLLDAALRLDSGNVLALRFKATLLEQEMEEDLGGDRKKILRELDQITSRAMERDDLDPRVVRARSQALASLGRWNAAIEASDQVIRLDPLHSTYYLDKAGLMNRVGRPADALPLIAKAMAMEPASTGYAFYSSCEANLLLGHANEAIASCEKASGLGSNDRTMPLLLLAAYENAGVSMKAAAAKADVDRILPGFTIAQLRARGNSDHPEYVKLAERYWYDGLRKAGIPEQ